MEEKDRLDQFFKATLSSQDAGASAEGWDLPSGRVWEGIEATLSDRKRPVAWWRTLLLVLLALMALIFAGLWLASQRQVKELEKTVAQHRQEIQEIIAANAVNTSNPSEAVQDNNQKVEQHKAVSGANRTKMAIGGRSESSDESRNKIAASTKSENLSLHTETPDLQGSIVVEEHQEVDLETGTPPAAFPSEVLLLNPLPIPNKWPLLKTDVTFALSPTLGGTPTDDAQKAAAKLLPLEISFSPVLSRRLLTYKGKDIDTKFERTETAGFSWTASVLTGVRLSEKLRLLTGLDYFGYSQESTHLMAMRYTLQNVVTDMAGNRISTYTTDLPTSFGDASIEIRVADDGAVNNPDLSEGRLFPVEVTAGTNIRQLGVPLLVEYQTGHGPVQWITRGGLIGNWIMDGEFELQRARVMHPRLQTRSFRLTGDKLTRRLNDFTLDVQLSSGALLNLSDRLKLSLLPSFRTNLSPIFNSSKLKTNIYSWSMNVGLAFEL